MENILDYYEVVNIYNYEEWEEQFKERYVELFSKYDYILGDQSAGILRLTGFMKEDFEKEYQYHLKHRCAYDAPYFIIKKK